MNTRVEMDSEFGTEIERYRAAGRMVRGEPVDEAFVDCAGTDALVCLLKERKTWEERLDFDGFSTSEGWMLQDVMLKTAPVIPTLIESAGRIQEQAYSAGYSRLVNEMRHLQHELKERALEEDFCTDATFNYFSELIVSFRAWQSMIDKHATSMELATF